MAISGSHWLFTRGHGNLVQCPAKRVFIERGAALCEDEIIQLRDLPEPVITAGRSETMREDLRTGGASFDETVARFEYELIREALERQAWNQTRTAEDLGITRRVLKLKMDRYEITPPATSAS